MNLKKSYRLLELAQFLKAELRGDGDCLIDSIAPLDKAGSGQISFFTDQRYQQLLQATGAAALLIRAEDAQNIPANLLIVTDPYLAYAKLTSLFNNAPKLDPGIHHSVVRGKGCDIDSSASIGAYCVIGDDVKIRANVIIGPGCFIGDGVSLGSETLLHSRVTLYHHVEIGQRVIVHSGAVIGSDGFGMANEAGRWRKIFQLGAVIIGNDVEIGANTTIDRGALENTVIEDGVKLDNLIQVGHNVRIGMHTAVAGCTGIAGSTAIGKHCMIAGGVGISGHLKITDKVTITAMSGVAYSIDEPGVYSSGLPAVSQRAWWRIVARLRNLDAFAKRLFSLEKKH